MNRVLPQEELPYDPESLNNLNITGSSANDDAMASPPSPSVLLHRNIFGAELASTASSGAAAASAAEAAAAAPSSAYENAHRNAFDDVVFNGGGEPSSSSSTSNKPKSIRFNIHHNYNTYEVVLSDQSTVGDLKKKIFELTAIPVCRQSLRGWIHSNQSYACTTKLSTMSLALENELIVSDIIEDGGVVDDEHIERLNATFTLNIFNEKVGSTIQLKFPGTHTVEEIKRDVYAVTNIAVRHQEWVRWPPGVTDTTPLALTGIPREQDFILRSTEPAASGSSRGSASARNEAIDIDSDSSVDEFEDASDFNGDDDIFTSSMTNKRIKHLSRYHDSQSIRLKQQTRF